MVGQHDGAYSRAKVLLLKSPVTVKTGLSKLRSEVMSLGEPAPSMPLLARSFSRPAISGGSHIRIAHVQQARCMSNVPYWMSSPRSSDLAETFSNLKPESQEALYLAQLMLSNLGEAQGHEFLVLNTKLTQITDGQNQLWYILGGILAVTTGGFWSLLTFLDQVKDDASSLMKIFSGNMGKIIAKLVSAVKNEMPIYFGRGEQFKWDEDWIKDNKDKKVTWKGGKDAYISFCALALLILLVAYLICC